MELLISKYQIKSKTLLDVISHPETSESEKKTAAACRRFVVGFIEDLKEFKKQ